MDVEKLKDIIAKHAKIKKEDLDLNANFKNDLHLDSIDIFQMILEIEETFNITLDNEVLLSIETVNDAISKISND